MALKIEVPYSRSVTSKRDPKATYQYLSEVERAIPGNFPGLELFMQTSPGVYHWRFQRVEHSGFGIAVELVTRFSFSEGKSITMEPVAEPGMGRLSGSWRLEPSAAGTLVHFEAKLTLELPIPFLLKSVAGPIAQKELTKLFDKYIGHVGQALS